MRKSRADTVILASGETAVTPGAVMKSHDLYRKMHFFRENLILNCDIQDFFKKNVELRSYLKVLGQQKNTIKYIR